MRFSRQPQPCNLMFECVFLLLQQLLVNTSTDLYSHHQLSKYKPLRVEKSNFSTKKDERTMYTTQHGRAREDRTVQMCEVQ